MIRRTVAVATLLACASPCFALDMPEIPKIGLPKLFGGGDEGQPPPPGATPDCPFIFLDPGASMLRSPAEADSASVRYQLSIRETARECVIEGDRLSVKVGIEGLVILGPQGQAGSYGGNLRVAIRDIRKDTVVTSKTLRAGAAVTSGASQAPFQIITDPFVLSVNSPKAQEDYEIIIGFTQGGASETAENPAQRPAKKKRRH